MVSEAAWYAMFLKLYNSLRYYTDCHGTPVLWKEQRDLWRAMELLGGTYTYA